MNRSCLLVGDLVYHERTIVAPLLAELTRRGYTVERAGGTMAFFIPDHYPRQVDEWVKDIPSTLEPYDFVLFLDWFHPAVPLYLYRAMTGGHKPPFYGLLHGSVALEGDVAREIPGAVEYERFLLDVYDAVFVHHLQFVQMVGGYHWPTGALEVVPFPMDTVLAHLRPDLPARRRVVFPHRWDFDKGNDTFTEFAHRAAAHGIECIVTAAPPPNAADLPVAFVGRLSPEALRGLCAQGGYVWSSVRQDVVAYAVWECLAWGLHPLLSDHPAYWMFPPGTHWTSYNHALGMVLAGDRLDNETWETLTAPLRFNTRRMVDRLCIQ